MEIFIFGNTRCSLTNTARATSELAERIPVVHCLQLDNNSMSFGFQVCSRHRAGGAYIIISSLYPLLYGIVCIIIIH